MSTQKVKVTDLFLSLSKQLLEAREQPEEVERLSKIRNRLVTVHAREMKKFLSVDDSLVKEILR